VGFPAQDITCINKEIPGTLCALLYKLTS